MKKMLAAVLVVLAGLFMLSASSVFAQEPCTADFNCDQNVDATDVSTFLGQFGRNPFNDPCPDCYDSACPCTFPCDPPAPVEKTGQATSYAPGDDGDLEKGVELPSPRFTDNTDGTITDNLTGLIWLRDAYCFGSKNWYDALSDCNGLADGQCGLIDGSSAGDWRLPNKRELISLTHDAYREPPITNTAGTGQLTHGDPFINVLYNNYWSSTNLVGGTSSAWIVLMSAGSVSASPKNLTLYPFWPVRDPL